MERKSLAAAFHALREKSSISVGDEADETEVLVGRIGASLVQTGRAFDEGESLFDVMDSIDQSVHDCYGALFDPKNDEWSASVLAANETSAGSFKVRVHKAPAESSCI